MADSTWEEASIVVIDDEPANVRLLEATLGRAGFRAVVGFTDPGAALAAIAAAEPDLILLDLHMPEPDGFTCLATIRRGQAPESYLPIVVLTADAEPGPKRRALALGATDFLAKPLDIEEVVLRARNLLETRRLHRELQARAEATIRETERTLAEAEGIAHVGSWTLDPTNGAATWSAEMYRILGLDPDGPAVGLADISALFTADSVTAVTAAIGRAVETGEPWQLDLEIGRPDGTHRWVASQGIAERDSTGATVRIRGTMQDITEQRRLDEQLRQSQKLEAVGQLTGGIAHDFNNILTAIRGYAEFARRGLEADPSRAADLDEVIANADRAAALVRQLLAFSRRQVLAPRVLEPASIVAGIAPMLRRLLGEHIELATSARPDAGRVKVDPSQLEQVIVNLAVNARDAMSVGGKLTIELANVELDAAYAADHPEVSPGPFVVLAVSDTGSGMDAATREHIFEPFFTTKEVGQGTGMGLATVYGIVRQSGGSIFVYSEPGAGTTFRIYFPRVAERPAAAEPVAVRPSTIGSETILLVEDEPSVRAFAQRALERQGYTVLAAENGAAALTLAASHGGPIALLVTDVIMPGLQGHELAEQLTAARPELRVLYVSGFTENSVIHHGVPDHDVAFLPKPFSADGLGSAVRAVLDGPAA
ncbi:MAG: response regulator [Candidatus Limnocylindrales bacterium]